MKYYEKLYFLKDNKQAVQSLISDFLLFRIYSSTVLRQAYRDWPTIRWFVKDNTPAEIQSLIDKSPHLSNRVLSSQLNAWKINRAVHTLEQYQNCRIPLTTDQAVPQKSQKLTSTKGDKALTILQQAVQEKQFSDRMATLATDTAHPFLFHDKYYYISYYCIAKKKKTG